MLQKTGNRLTNLPIIRHCIIIKKLFDIIQLNPDKQRLEFHLPKNSVIIADGHLALKVNGSAVIKTNNNLFLNPDIQVNAKMTTTQIIGDAKHDADTKTKEFNKLLNNAGSSCPTKTY